MMLGLVVAMVAPTKMVAQACFKAHAFPRCHTFWITEAGVSHRLGPILGGTDGSATLEVGYMVNTRGSSAFGAALFWREGEPVTGVGIRPRYRRWLNPRISVDLAPGIIVYSGGHRPSPTLSTQAAINWGPSFALTAQMDVVRRRPKGTELAWYGGGRLGGGLGTAGMLGGLALFALVIATP